MSEKKELSYDMVILGGGPAGLSAAIYAARGALKTAIVDISLLGGQPNNYLEIENYPGLGKTGGFELAEAFEKHVDLFNVDKYQMQEIVKADVTSQEKTIETLEYIFKTNTVVVATGAQAQKLGVPGEKEFVGRGVSYCAVCDGAFFKDKEVSVVGGGNSAVEEAIYLTKFASKVNIIHRRDALRADKVYQQRAFDNPKINMVWDSTVEEVKGENTVNTVVLRNTKTGEISEMKTDGVFPYIGITANSDLLKSSIKLSPQGFIETDINLSTSCTGVYAAGDVRVTPLRQVVVSAADGAIAATSAIKYLETLETKVSV